MPQADNDHTKETEKPLSGHALIALGANLPGEEGPPEITLRSALSVLEQAGVRLLRVSRFYRTPCFPVGAGPDYVNAAAAISTGLSPEALLALLHATEAGFGRARELRWGMRTLDLDLLALDGAVLPDLATWSHWQGLPAEAQRLHAPQELILPHPRMHERAFVLVPLAEIAPEWQHPVLGLTVAAMCENLPLADRKAVKPLASG